MSILLSLYITIIKSAIRVYNSCVSEKSNKSSLDPRVDRLSRNFHELNQEYHTNPFRRNQDHRRRPQMRRKDRIYFYYIVEVFLHQIILAISEDISSPGHLVVSYLP